MRSSPLLLVVARVAHVAIVVFGFGAAASSPLRAVESRLTILLDVDDNEATGCSISGLGGVEQRVLTTVETASAPGESAQVVRIEGFDCANTQTFLDTTVRPVGVRPLGSHSLNVVETFWQRVVPIGPAVRLYVLAENDSGGSDDLVTADGTVDGPRILFGLAPEGVEIPTLGEGALVLNFLLLAGAAWWRLRRAGASRFDSGPSRALLLAVMLLGLAGAAWATVAIIGASDLDGTTLGEWPPAARVADDPASTDDGDDVAALYVLQNDSASPQRLDFRIDASLVYNQAPVAAAQAVTVTEDSSPTPITLTGSDADSDPLTFSIVPGSGPDFGALAGTPPNVTYTPNANFSGSDAFDFEVDDGNGGTGTATVSITVSPTNDPPTVDPSADPAAILEDAGSQTVNLTGISAGPGEASQPLQVTAVSVNPGLVPDPTVTYTSPSATGALSFTPVANASGTVDITVTVTDGGLDNNLATPGDNGTTSDLFQVVVNPVNDAPTFTIAGNPAASPENGGAQSVSGFASAISPGPFEAGQVLTFQLTPTGTTGLLTFGAGPAIDASGNLTYAAATNAWGTASFDVVLQDDGGTANGGNNTSTTASFTISVAADDNFEIFTGAGANAALVIDAAGGPNVFTFTGNGTGTGSVTITSSGTLALNFSGHSTGLGSAGSPISIAVGTFSVGTFSVTLNQAVNQLVGTASADFVNGGGSIETISGGGGSDTLDGGGGNDTLNGDAGTDTLYGGVGSDTINGGSEADLIYGGVNCEGALLGSADSGDTLNGGTGADAVYGGNNNAAPAVGNCTDLGDSITDTSVDSGDSIFGGNNNSGGGTGGDGADTILVTGGVDSIVGGNNNTGGGTGGDAGDTMNTDDTPDDNDFVVGDNTGGAGATGADTITADAGEVDATNNAP